MTPKPKLLLIEDNADDEALSLRAINRSTIPCEVGVIRHGGEAAAIFNAECAVPDLIVLDFHLPGRNGLEVLKVLRSHQRTKHVPVVMLSALDSNEEIAQCLSEGANSCVQKPLDPQLYVEHVAMIVQYWLKVNRRPEPGAWIGRAAQIVAPETWTQIAPGAATACQTHLC